MINISRLWSKNIEKEFFTKTLKVAVPEQLFYITEDGRYIAYWPKNYKGIKATLQSRNAFIGSFTEKWTKELLEETAEELGAFTVQGVICEDIGLSAKSPADVAICKTRDQHQKPENILMIIEVKMSIVWNWEYNPSTGELKSIGDYTTHQGNPGLLRSDTILKAIGKSINIRVSSFKSAQIPIVILGNTPITDSYYEKVDHLKKTGVIQGFYSTNPQPLDDPIHKNNIKSTPGRGFLRFDSYEEMKQELINLISEEQEFFSGMKTKKELGKIIEIANLEPTYEKKAEMFLKLLRDENER
ncbi:hypothetical protein [Dictyoglomus thermophilum]|uniref:Uncharacterized protein n=1 Tax=Dictyoglomus thermophilum (strain ATCC 35947 / DSM 3960 / H-6-12) TaxID=309799 RepID=B5YC29_DICT6|nr:hypothetical protein [Dictyoglomus thermophilum]ACI18653.1 hypothetical protein DICTH_0254 [Dictyoglomus thermophilum H-6-12]MCX7720016.1 hypothetical protein [Dictyoglomus thermophilum]